MESKRISECPISFLFSENTSKNCRVVDVLRKHLRFCEYSRPTKNSSIASLAIIGFICDR
jgi:hypothetical protein